MDFHKITLDDKAWIQDRLAVEKAYATEYCFSTIYHWQDAYRCAIAAYKGFVIMESWAQDRLSYSYFGDGDRRDLIETLRQEAAAQGQKLHLNSLLAGEKQRLERELPGLLRFEEDRDAFDYCYSQQKLALLPGRKLSSKRAHVRKFIQAAPDWRYEALTQENLGDCRRLLLDWYHEKESQPDSDLAALEEERHALDIALDNLEEEELFGGLLRVEGRAVAMALGHAVTADTVVEHFEKALLDYPGIYTMICQQFAAVSCAGYQRINREDDAGAPGLRQAKLAYEPDELLKKYTATWAED